MLPWLKFVDPAAGMMDGSQFEARVRSLSRYSTCYENEKVFFSRRGHFGKRFLRSDWRNDADVFQMTNE